MTEQNTRDKGTLILAFIAGLSINGSFSALFTDGVPFSFFLSSRWRFLCGICISAI